MSSNSASLYFLKIKIVPQKEGQDVPLLVSKISSLLSDQEPNIKIIHKFKVTGEAKVLAFVQVSDVPSLERTLTGIWKLGPIDVDSQPVICFENFAENMKVDDELCKKSTSCLKREGLYFVDIRLEYHGLTFEDFLALWKKEAETVLSLRSKGEVSTLAFKCVAQRRVLGIINSPEAAKFDYMAMTMPIMIENGFNIQARTKSLQFVDDYLAAVQ